VPTVPTGNSTLPMLTNTNRDREMDTNRYKVTSN